MPADSNSLIEKLRTSIQTGNENYTFWARQGNYSLESGIDGDEWYVIEDIAQGEIEGIPDDYKERAILLLAAKKDAARWAEEQAYKMHDVTDDEQWDPSKTLEENLAYIAPSCREDIIDDAQIIYRCLGEVHNLLQFKKELAHKLIHYLETGEQKQLEKIF